MSNINETTVDLSWKVEDSYSTGLSVISVLCLTVTLILILTNRIKTTVRVKKYAVGSQILSLMLHIFYYSISYRSWDDGIENWRMFIFLEGLWNISGKFQLKLGHTCVLLTSLMNAEILGILQR
jgi:hypothetical protein